MRALIITIALLLAACSFPTGLERDMGVDTLDDMDSSPDGDIGPPDISADMPDTPDAPDMSDGDTDMPTVRALSRDEMALVVTSAPVEITVSWAQHDGVAYLLQIDDGEWLPVGDETEYVDKAAPAITIMQARTIAASPQREHVALSADVRTDFAVMRTYRIRAIDAKGRVIGESHPETGRRQAGTRSIRWWRQDNGGPARELTTDPMDTWLDTDAASDGAPSTYWCTVELEDGAQARCNDAEGARLAAVQVATGYKHTCALLSNGRAKCWGNNDRGQIGSGTSGIQGPGAELEFVDPAVQIVTGIEHTCVRTTIGTVHCWGSREHGQAGIAGTADIATPPPWTVPLGGKAAVKIASHGHHTCALLADASMACWGRNNRGQLGKGDLFDSPDPVTVLQGVDDIVVGFEHTCARQGTQMRCWGDDAGWQLGYVNWMLDYMTAPLMEPISRSQVPIPAGLLAAGEYNSCGLSAAGALYCWGAGDNGQLGTGTTPIAQFEPVQAMGTFLDADRIDLGGYTACLSQRGGLHCWGDGQASHLGTGSGDDLPFVPTDPIALGEQVTSWDMAEQHICAVMEAGVVKCWGHNDYGQLGNTNLSEVIGDRPGEMPPPDVPLF